MRCPFFIAVLLLSFIQPLRAQQPEPSQTATLNVITRLVSIDAVVHNAHGDLADGLSKDFFTLREDGHAVPIRYFNHDSDLPLTVGLLVDTSGSELEYFSDEAMASNLFLENVLTRPADRAFVLRFDTKIQLLQPMTPSLPQLRNALRLIEYNPDPTSPRAAVARCSMTPS